MHYKNCQLTASNNFYFWNIVFAEFWDSFCSPQVGNDVGLWSCLFIIMIALFISEFTWNPSTEKFPNWVLTNNRRLKKDIVESRVRDQMLHMPIQSKNLFLWYRKCVKDFLVIKIAKLNAITIKYWLNICDHALALLKDCITDPLVAFHLFDLALIVISNLYTNNFCVPCYFFK